MWFAGLGVNLGINIAFLRRWRHRVASVASSAAYAVLLGLHVRMFARDLGGYRALRPDFLREAIGMMRSLVRRPAVKPTV